MNEAYWLGLHTPRLSTNHENKSNKQEKARLPHSRGVSIIIPSNSILVDEEHTKERADAWHSLNELDVYGRWETEFGIVRVGMCR